MTVFWFLVEPFVVTVAAGTIVAGGIIGLGYCAYRAVRWRLIEMRHAGLETLEEQGATMFDRAPDRRTWS